MLASAAIAMLPSFALIPAPVAIEARPGHYATDVTEPQGFRALARVDLDHPDLGPEAYRLRVTSEQVTIEASSEAGVFYATQTLAQLHDGEGIPAVEIEDAPRFSWRGLHLDVARHFMPKEWILRFIDEMARLKLNRFHLHLTDDQGWRIEIRRYPKLTEVGAFRPSTMLTYSPPTYTGEPHGGCYTQDDLREIVAFAAGRHIVVIPEIEMPGHAQAAIAAYPELGVSGQPMPVRIDWGVSEDVFNTEESTIAFLHGVLEEVLEIFPSPWIHIGGDECPKTQWRADPRTQQLMVERGIATEDELQSWFIRQMDAWLDARGRRLIGWDEILEGGLAEGATVMAWRGMEFGTEAAALGHDVVMAPTSHTYFDYYQSRDTAREPHAIGGYLPLGTVYAFDPVPDDLPEGRLHHILGVQGQIWTEYIRTPDHAEYMAFPRAHALAEVAWSPEDRRDWANFLERLRPSLSRLGGRGVNFRPLDEAGA